MFMILPRKSSLVLLTDTGAGVVGAEELNSLVGVSCCNGTEEWGLLYLAQSLMSKSLNMRLIPDQKDRLWHHQKRTHFVLCPSPCPLVPWVISADSSARHVCLHPFPWQQSPSGSFHPLAHLPPHRRGRFQRTDLSAFLSDFRSHHRRILCRWGEEWEQAEGGQGTAELVLLRKWKQWRHVR